MHIRFRCNARFLWKRIPNNVKEGNKELEQMHQVFKCLWNNNMVQFNEAINFEWSRDVAELMFELKGIEISYKPHST